MDHHGHHEFPEIPRPRDIECINAVTHFFGLAVSGIAVCLIWRSTASLDPVVAVAYHVYTATLVAMFAISALSHWVDEPARKHSLRVLDQGEIYLLIAGTYTPFIAMYTAGWLRWAGLSLLWLVAIRLFLRKVVSHSDIMAFSARSYLALGWIPATILSAFLPIGCFLGLLAGGLFYSIGTWFLLNDTRARFYHPLWHTFVMIASGVHYYVVWAYVLSV